MLFVGFSNLVETTGKTVVYRSTLRENLKIPNKFFALDQEHRLFCCWLAEKLPRTHVQPLCVSVPRVMGKLVQHVLIMLIGYAAE